MCFPSVTISDVIFKSDGIRKRRNEKSEARVAKKRWTKCVRARKEVGVKGKVAQVRIIRNVSFVATSVIVAT